MTADDTPRELTCCPACDGTDIHARTGTWGKPASDTPSDRYRCYACDTTFDTPATRPAKHDQPHRRGLAGRLAAVDPASVSIRPTGEEASE
ncbi:hypothetical protein [Halosegnis longus]|uniref:hypothetical protein n=1 Tax=Halosegnis longus TaxID=2216012 RepID=UPI00129DD5DB|nr:hypothetical protein [Halosegnis longus]